MQWSGQRTRGTWSRNDQHAFGSVHGFLNSNDTSRFFLKTASCPHRSARKNPKLRRWFSCFSAVRDRLDLHCSRVVFFTFLVNVIAAGTTALSPSMHSTVVRASRAVLQRCGGARARLQVSARRPSAERPPSLSVHRIAVRRVHSQRTNQHSVLGVGKLETLFGWHKFFSSAAVAVAWLSMTNVLHADEEGESGEQRMRTVYGWTRHPHDFSASSEANKNSKALLLISDVDYTMTGDNDSLHTFNEWWLKEQQPRNSCLVYNTARPCGYGGISLSGSGYTHLVQSARYDLMRPDVLITCEGTEVFLSLIHI